MSEREAMVRKVVVTYFPMFIATLSLITSIYNGYLNNKFVDIIQRNITRTEHLKTCKEIIDAYFQVKFHAALVSENAARDRASGARQPASMALIDPENAINKFAALGTYLANLRDDASREQYTHLSWELDKLVREAINTPSADLDKRFEAADQMFGCERRLCEDRQAVNGRNTTPSAALHRQAASPGQVPIEAATNEYFAAASAERS
jgi:hypothetical protein